MNKPIGFPELPDGWRYLESAWWDDVWHVANPDTAMAFSVHLKRRTVALGFTIPYSIYPNDIEFKPPTGRGWQLKLIEQGFRLLGEPYRQDEKDAP